MRLYWDLIKQSDDSSAGRMVRNICQYMFTDDEVTEPQDDKENFFWSNIVDLLEEDKQIELSGKQPKNLNAKMRHFTFVDTYYKAIKLMSEAESGQYVKAICEYMFNGTEQKLKSPVDAYFALAKRKLELSRTRKKIGAVGGKQERVKVTDDQVEVITNTDCGVSFDEFMRMHPNVENDLYASRQHLLNGIDWAWLDVGWIITSNGTSKRNEAASADGREKYLARIYLVQQRELGKDRRSRKMYRAH